MNRGTTGSNAGEADQLNHTGPIVYNTPMTNQDNPDINNINLTMCNNNTNKKKKNNIINSNNPNDSPSTYPSTETPTDNVTSRITSSRTQPTRSAKTAAIKKMQTRLPMPPDARELACPQLPNVEVRIGTSRVNGAGTGFFLLRGPNNDGSADVGTRIATYDGPRYTTPADFTRLLHPDYHSDYLFEGVDPYTDICYIIDGSPKTSYGPFMNDGLGDHPANCSLEFGEDGRLYVVLIAPMEPHDEGFFEYGGPFWTEPRRWSSLDTRTQISVNRLYNTGLAIEHPPLLSTNDPPNTSIPSATPTQALQHFFGITFSHPPLGSDIASAPRLKPRRAKVATSPSTPPQPSSFPTRSIKDSPLWKASLGSPPLSLPTQPCSTATDPIIPRVPKSRWPKPSTHTPATPTLPNLPPAITGPSHAENNCDIPPTYELHSQQRTPPTSTLPPHPPANVTIARPPLPDRPSSNSSLHTTNVTDCYGQSPDESIRLTLHSSGSGPSFDTIADLLSNSIRSDAPALLLPLIRQAKIYYWKKVDPQHRLTSIPNGACGWYTVMQILNRNRGKTILDFRTAKDVEEGIDLLREVLRCTELTHQQRQSAIFVMDFMRKVLIHPTITLPPEHELRESLLFKLISSVPSALFIAPNHERRLRMPDKTPWARLTYSTFNADPTHEEIAMESALWMADQQPNYAVLHGYHYWIFPLSSLELLQLDLSMVDLAYTIWDFHHGGTAQLLTRPAHNPTPTTNANPRRVRVTRYKNGRPHSSAEMGSQCTTRLEPDLALPPVSPDHTPHTALINAHGPTYHLDDLPLPMDIDPDHEILRTATSNLAPTSRPSQLLWDNSERLNTTDEQHMDIAPAIAPPTATPQTIGRATHSTRKKTKQRICHRLKEHVHALQL